MKTVYRIIATAAALLAAVAVYAQPKTELRPSETVLFYADSFEGIADPVYGEKIVYAGFEMKESSKIEKAESINKSGNIFNMSDHARMDLYFPKEKNGQMVVVCPGGGYGALASYHEGLYVAHWLLERGISVAVVKYRMPNGHRRIPHVDVENAFRYCRKNAAKWGIDQIGVMGFSAGGHLAATTSTMWTEEVTRPDFSVLIYPVITMEVGLTHKGTRENLLTEKAIWSSHNSEKYSMENQVTRFTPPTFLALSSDDMTVPAENSLRYYNRLIDNEVPAEMHIYPTGGHGWGFLEPNPDGSGKDVMSYAREEFEASLERWLEGVRKK
jgi:acetyl esterase/lipase